MFWNDIIHCLDLKMTFIEKFPWGAIQLEILIVNEKSPTFFFLFMYEVGMPNKEMIFFNLMKWLLDSVQKFHHPYASDDG